MISVIISTYRSDYFQAIQKNIDETIGVEYEIVAIENRNGAKGLCEVYNTGTQKAKYPLLCFAHEDIDIKTKNWGQKVIAAFSENERLGLLGVAGSSYKCVVPSGWTFEGIHGSVFYINLLQTFKKKQIKGSFFHSNPKNETLSKVVAIDGLWFCTKKETALEIPFDQQTFKRFHAYDVDFSLSVLQKYDVAVTYEILIEHFSEGNYDKVWIEEIFKLHKKWYSKLPIRLGEVDEKVLVWTEEGAFTFLLSTMLKNNYMYNKLIGVLWDKKVRKALSPKAFAKLHWVLIRMLFQHLGAKRGFVQQHPIES